MLAIEKAYGGDPVDLAVLLCQEPLMEISRAVRRDLATLIMASLSSAATRRRALNAREEKEAIETYNYLRAEWGWDAAGARIKKQAKSHNDACAEVEARFHLGEKTLQRYLSPKRRRD